MTYHGPVELERARAALSDARRILALTGAGISAESGAPTFRGPDGLWQGRRPEEIATPSAFSADPRAVWEWYGWRRERLARCSPNPGHRALARLALDRTGVTLVTQNVDGLHHEAARLEAGTAASSDAGAAAPDRAYPIELHGSIFRVRCTSCTERYEHRDPIDARTAGALPRCRGCDRLLRPDVVWFGEPLPAASLESAFHAAEIADVCLVIGTSALVYPAAGIPQAASAAGATVIEINPEPTALTAIADIPVRQTSAIALPAVIDRA